MTTGAGAKTRAPTSAATVAADLATAPAQARRFVAARRRRAAETLEDYTELIADLIAHDGEARTTDIAERLGVAHPDRDQGDRQAQREGLAVVQPYHGVSLTAAGRTMAERVRRRHRLVVDFLVAVGAPREAAEADAEGIEHYVSSATLAAFEAFLAAQRK